MVQTCSAARLEVYSSVHEVCYLLSDVSRSFGDIFFTFTWPCIVTNFLIIKPTKCTNFSNLFLEWHSTRFGQFLCPSSGVIHCTHNNVICYTDCFRVAGPGWNCSSILVLLKSCLQTCMTYTIAECTVHISRWWTEELYETCRVSLMSPCLKHL
jgi:hypothetical protein